eukprot:3939236-Rhodomonas_salina.1
MLKKGKGEKKLDKKPDEQLPQGDGVPAFLAAEGNTALSKDTQQLGKELFESFSKNPAGIWFAKTAAGVKIEELHDLPPQLMSSDSESDWVSEDEEYNENEQHDSTVHNIANTSPCALLQLLAWMLATALHLFNTACIKILSWNLAKLLIITGLLLVTANVGPNSVVWVAVGVLLTSFNQHCRITRKEINS